MVRKRFTTIIFLGMLLPGFAQQAEVNEEGKRIVRYSDGSWKYLDAEAEAAQTRLSMLEDSIKKVSLALIQARMEWLNAEILRADTSRSEVKENLDWKKKVEDLAASLQEIRQALQIEISAQTKPSGGQISIPKNGASTRSASLPEAFDFLKNPPKLPCEPERSTVETPSGVLFRHTEKTLEPHFQHHDLLVCKAGLAQAGEGLVALHLIVLASTEKAPEIFGSVEQGAVLEILMLNGEALLLQNLVSDGGTWLPGSGVYLWRATYRLGSKDRKKLASSETDKVTFRWSKAEQTFEVFDPDFFIRQLDCLENGK